MAFSPFLPSVCCEFIWNPWLHQLKCSQQCNFFFSSNYPFNFLLLNSHTSSPLPDCLYFFQRASENCLSCSFHPFPAPYSRNHSLVPSLAVILQEWMWITTFTTVSDKLPHGEIICDIKSMFLLLRPLYSTLASGKDSSDYEEVLYKPIVLYFWREILHPMTSPGSTSSC